MKKIALIVDDNPVIRKNIREILIDADFETFEANDGISAIEMYKKVHPSIVTMDINMPYQNGLDTTKKIIEINKEAKILMCSSMLFLPYYQKLALSLGAKSLVSKPFTKMELIEGLNRLLESDKTK